MLLTDYLNREKNKMKSPPKRHLEHVASPFSSGNPSIRSSTGPEARLNAGTGSQPARPVVRGGCLAPTPLSSTSPVPMSRDLQAGGSGQRASAAGSFTASAHSLCVPVQGAEERSVVPLTHRGHFSNGLKVALPPFWLVHPPEWQWLGCSWLQR